MSVEFHTPAYEGPLDLLLALIQKAEVNIYDIPIALITDQFLEYLHKAEEIKLGDLSEFYKMAAELIYIKSQLMLPVEVEFDEEYVDPREELVERLLEYSKFKKYSELLMGNEDTESVMIQRKPTEFILPFSDEDLWEDINTYDLHDTFVKMMEELNSMGEAILVNVFEKVTENQKRTLMNELLENRDSIKFSELFIEHKPEHIICSFIAVLEAVKDKVILVDQAEPFGDMVLTKRPQDWNPNLADDYDSQYDEMLTNNLQDEEDFSIIDESEEDSEESESADYSEDTKEEQDETI